MKAGKIWGDTESLLVTPMIEVHRINVLPHMHCSMHKHNMKWSMFYVIKGELEIHQKKTDYELIDVTKIKAGEWTTVPPGEYHMFQSNDLETQALEIYYLEAISTDIIRESVGGFVNDTDTKQLLNEQLN